MTWLRFCREAPVTTGRLVMLWYGGLILAGLLVHGALGSAQSTPLSAALLAAAVVVLLTLLTYTLRPGAEAISSQVLVPAVGPVVIAVLMLEYIDYSRRMEDTYSSQLIPSELVELSDVRWTAGAAGTRGGHLSGTVRNRSPNRLVGMSLEVLVYEGQQQLQSATLDAQLRVPPWQRQGFRLHTGPIPINGLNRLTCVDISQGGVPAPPRADGLRPIECAYRLAGTRGEDVE